MAKTYIYKDTNVKSSIFDYIQYNDVKVTNTKLLLVRGILSQYLSPDISDKKYINAIDIYWNNPVAKPKNSPEINLGIYTTSDLLNYIKNSFSYNNININGLIKKSDLDNYMNLSSLKTDIDYYILQINNILNRKFSYIDKNETTLGYDSIERGRKKRCLCRYTDDDTTGNRIPENIDDLTYKFISYKDRDNVCAKLDWELIIDNKASENINTNDNYYSGTHDFSHEATLYLPENRNNEYFFSISKNIYDIFTISINDTITELSDKIITIKLKQHNDENSSQLGNLEDVAELTYECTFLTNNANNDVDTRLVINDIQYKGQSLYGDSSIISEFNSNLFYNDAINVECGKGASINISYYYYFRWYDHITDYTENGNENTGPWHGAYIFRDPTNIQEKYYYNINEPNLYYTVENPKDKYIIISNDVDKLKQLILNPASEAHRIVIKNLKLLNDEGTDFNPYIHFYERKNLGFINQGSGSPYYEDENGNEKHLGLDNLFEYSYKILDYMANSGHSESNIITANYSLSFGDVFRYWQHWKVNKNVKYETKLLSDKLAIYDDSYLLSSDSTINSYHGVPDRSLYYIPNLGSDYYYRHSHQKAVYATSFPNWHEGTTMKNKGLFDIKFNVGPDEIINYYSFISAKINYYNDAPPRSQETNYKIYTHAPIITYRIDRQLFSFVYTGDPNDPNTELIFVKARHGKASDFFEDYNPDNDDNSNFDDLQDENVKGSRILYTYDETKHEIINDYIEIDSDSVEITTNIYVYYNQRMKGYKIGGEDNTRECWEDDNIKWWKYTSYSQTYSLLSRFTGQSNSGNGAIVTDLFGLSDYNDYDYIYRLMYNADNTIKKIYHGEDFTHGNPNNYYGSLLNYYDDEGNFIYGIYYNGKNSWLSEVGLIEENILVEDYLKNTYYNNEKARIVLRRK